MLWSRRSLLRHRHLAAGAGGQGPPRRWRRAAGEVTSDAEAFLLGRLAERSEMLTGCVPVWAWTNLLAHGSEKDLRAESAATWQQGTASLKWREARSYLAGEVLRWAEVYGSLGEAQEALLVPLELRLASSTEVRRWWPGRWVMAVEGALARKRPAGQPT